MADHSHIEWTDTTWNPVTGCTKVSPGCDHCYAQRIVERFHGKGAFNIVVRNETRLHAPLHWRRPRRVFVNSMSDLSGGVESGLVQLAALFSLVSAAARSIWRPRQMLRTWALVGGVSG